MVTEAHLVVQGGARAGVAVPCGLQPVVIGADAASELALPDPGVSARHAQVSPTAGGLVLRDLDSTGGTFVGDRRVREAFVHPGSVVRIGATSLRIELRARAGQLPPSAAPRFGRLVGKSPRMRALFALLEQLAKVEASVLITGLSGTGKELVARSIHETSPRASAPLAVLDCAATDRARAELFGHEANGYPGAVGRRAGVFEQAQGGTVFLDHVGALPADLQPLLQRALESREVRRLGGNASIKLDVRVLTATDRPVTELVAAGSFREDLYLRLFQVELTLPPLEERREDIPLLVDAILGSLPMPKTLAPDALAVLATAAFPGNVRQLRSIVERAAMMARGPLIEKAHLILTGGEEKKRSGRSALPRG